MDPDATLAELRAAVAKYRNATRRYTAAEAARDAIEHIEALDEWLSKGGYPPKAWPRVF